MALTMNLLPEREGEKDVTRNVHTHEASKERK